MAISSGLLCAVSGQLATLTGAAVVGAAVTVTPLVEHGFVLRATDGTIVDPRPVSATTDASGRFSLTLLRSAAAVPSGLTYQLKAPNIDARIRVPDAAGGWLADLLV